MDGMFCAGISCPLCGGEDLEPFGPSSHRCADCEVLLWGPMLRTLGAVRNLPVALGRHACECDHPEMRLLPDGVRHCPACRAEVLPADYGEPSGEYPGKTGSTA